MDSMVGRIMNLKIILSIFYGDKFRNNELAQPLGVSVDQSIYKHNKTIFP